MRDHTKFKFRVWDNVEKRFAVVAMPLVMLSGWLAGAHAKGDDLSRYEYLEYVGMNDKNAREACEGDITIDPQGVKRIIFYDDKNAMFRFTDRFGEPVLTMMQRLREMEIIGNVKEDVGLLA